jgi:hypothetical protein
MSATVNARAVRMAGVASMLMLPMLVMGQVSTDATVIGDHALAGAVGSVAVNAAAGAGNAQANLGVIVNDGVGSLRSSQHAGMVAAAANASSTIGAGVFAGASGILSTNLASGNGNLQTNAALVAPAGSAIIETMSDGLLATVTAHAGQGDASSHAPRLREAVVHPDAYRNANGLVQLNQTAGSGNTSANSFVLRPPAGTFFQ